MNNAFYANAYAFDLSLEKWEKEFLNNPPEGPLVENTISNLKRKRRIVEANRQLQIEHLQNELAKNEKHLNTIHHKLHAIKVLAATDKDDDDELFLLECEKEVRQWKKQKELNESNQDVTLAYLIPEATV